MGHAHRVHPLPRALPVPLRVHGRYSRAEVLAAFAIHDGRGAPRSHREGVLWHQSSATDLLFITLRKSEALFSPSTRQARGSRVLLFVREQRKQDGRSGGPTEPFVCLGFASYESHEGERPMAIRWRLERQIPAAWLPVMALAV